MALKDLQEWKSSNRRKPLILQGARQVGKSFLVQEFARKNYKKFIHLNFELQTNFYTIFESTIEPLKIIEKLGQLLEVKIEAKDTLIFFDEIQACPRALTSLKYFYELANEYHIIAAGSLLGISVGDNKASFPVGKVNFLNLYPMSFYEFLVANGKEQLATLLKEKPIEIVYEVTSKSIVLHLYVELLQEEIQLVLMAL